MTKINNTDNTDNTDNISLMVRNNITNRLNLLKIHLCYEYKIPIDDADEVYKKLI